MINIDCYKGKKFALFGLGASGIASAKALMQGGASVVCWDDSEASRLRASQYSIDLCHLQEINWNDIYALILAPGVALNYPASHWSVQLARKNNVKIIGDIELFVAQRNYFLNKNNLKNKDVPFIAITGTNGKSTTTSLIVHLLQSMGKNVEMGGNIGRPILDLAPLKKDIFYIIECSSFQIELAPSINPDVGILLNVTPDHIECHGTIQNYENIKKQLIYNSDIGFVPENIKFCKKTRLHPVSLHTQSASGYYAHNSKLYYNKKLLADLSSILSLLGPHNAQNALNAIGGIKEFLGEETTNFSWQQACETYKSLPHRMQYVRKIGRVSFVNDSKATNAEASMQALETFSNIYWIIGGIAKKGGIDNLKSLFYKIKTAYLIGESAQDFAQTIDTSFNFFNCGTLERAVKKAFDDAYKDKNTSVILLSPACASYDQFANYSARGDAFINIVNNL